MNAIASFFHEFGEVNGLLILGIIGMFLWVRRLDARIHKQHLAQLKDRQDEINRLAADNHAYRERYLSAFDRHTQREDNTS